MIVAAQFFRDDLVFYRSQIEIGQWWLLISGNFVHSNYPHLFMNLAGLWILGFLFIDSLSLKTFIISTLILGVFVGLGLYYFNPELQKYYGFSGILYGLFLVGSITAILNKDHFTGIATAIVIIAKITWDLIYGGNSSSAELIGVPVAIHAHLYGAIGAIFVSIGLYLMYLRRI
jgi:rhomboid family GlyGly-CTERM serine protease